MLASEKTEVNWEAFGQYLRANFGRETVDVRILYAKKYAHLLLQRDITPLYQHTAQTRLNIMKSLVTLSIFLGIYQQWKILKQESGLTWTDPEATIKTVEKIMAEEGDGVGNLDDMKKWVNTVTERLPPKYGDVVRYNLLTGLRPTEAIESIRLFHSEPGNYVSRKYGGMLLEHMKYKRLFLRRTKKAFVSIITDELRNLATQYNGGYITYNAMMCKFKRMDLPCHLEYCRQIYATVLRQNGVETEMIDLLQGRVPAKVFLRHYYRPNFNEEIGKIKNIIENKLGSI